ncbi:hypothetical protein ANCCAN_25322 [Ancylostoma caninum]|uniref:Uncharacterized protein n=1 Tax=Ancylostoma caninum TaxID=29170 RepID=A0A368FBF3_ANCCA|nr:hypothetical protein ANCCAN_25322 [Ancylostoma caninum]
MDGPLPAKEDDEQQRREDVAWAEAGSSLRRVKSGKLRSSNHVSIKEGKYLNYYKSYFFSFIPNSLKSGQFSFRNEFAFVLFFFLLCVNRRYGTHGISAVIFVLYLDGHVLSHPSQSFPLSFVFLRQSLHFPVRIPIVCAGTNEI